MMSAPHPVTRLPRGFYWVLAAGGLLAMMHLVGRLGTPVIYGDDITQDYVLARAILNDQDPYTLPPSELAERYLPAAGHQGIPHVSLHPPAAALPLGLALGPRDRGAQRRGVGGGLHLGRRVGEPTHLDGDGGHCEDGHHEDAREDHRDSPLSRAPAAPVRGDGPVHPWGIGNPSVSLASAAHSLQRLVRREP
jgi:hypothetical protein